MLITEDLQAPVLKATRRYIPHTVAVKKTMAQVARGFSSFKLPFLAHSLQKKKKKKNHNKKTKTTTQEKMQINYTLIALVFKITELS